MFGTDYVGARGRGVLNRIGCPPALCLDGEFLDLRKVSLRLVAVVAVVVFSQKEGACDMMNGE